MWAGQDGYDVRFQWGPAVAPALTGGTCVVVDVLRFTTTVEAAVTRGVTVYPYRWRDATAAAFAGSLQALLAGHGDASGPSLSPVSMSALAPGRLWRSRRPTARPALSWQQKPARG